MTTAPSATAPRLPERYLYPRLDANGKHVFTPELTHASRTDPVGLICSTVRSLPIVFVPGTMGSNLKVIGQQEQVWRFDGLVSLASQQVLRSAGRRQMYLHPDRTEVDPNGAVPKSVGILTAEEHFRQRGWGEIAAASYQSTLIWLEETFHGQRGVGIGESPHQIFNAGLREISDGIRWQIRKGFEPLTADQCRNAEEWVYPVYAFGYNWLQSNEVSANKLAARIRQIIAANNSKAGRCEQVIVVTHSMGGLVARRCAQLPGMFAAIAGIVHGVMPAIGAAVTYRRCKVGMWDENLLASLVIGSNGREITAVFAQSPGALELLPAADYRTDWLRFSFGGTEPMTNSYAAGNYHETIYKTRNRWWGLIKEEWLNPRDGISIDWVTYEKSLNKAIVFQQKIRNGYHHNSWAFYGFGIPTSETVSWTSEPGNTHSYNIAAPTRAEALDGSGADASRDSRGVFHWQDRQVAQGGSNLLYMHGPEAARAVPGSTQKVFNQTVHYILHAKKPAEDGDGTVPVLSGRAPQPHIKQIFAISGLEHEPAYKSKDARNVTGYAIVRIAELATRFFDIPPPKPYP